MDIVVYGTAYTPDYDADAPRTNVFKHADMTPELAAKTVGLPVFIEHDDAYPIGTVAHAEIDARRFMRVALHVRGNPIAAELLPGALSVDPDTGKRFFTGLSMGTDVTLDLRSRAFTTVAAVRPTEISIVRRPDRPMADITDYDLVPHSTTRKELFATIRKKFESAVK